MILEAKQVSNRGHKFGITAGASTIQKFKTLDAAQNALDSKRSFYEYWAGSASVAVDNSKKVYVKA